MSREAKILIGILVVIVGGMIGLFVVMNQGGSTNTGGLVDDKTLIKSTTHQEGSGSVKLVEFGDYQCPACGNAYPIVQQIMKDYQGKVTLYFRNFPLTNLHPNATVAANAAEEAADLGKFWQMHDLLYEKQKEWVGLPQAQAIAKFADYANSLGIDGSKVADAATNQTEKSRIDADVTDGNTLQVNATPTFYVNDRQVTSGVGYNDLKAAIDAALKGK